MNKTDISGRANKSQSLEPAGKLSTLYQQIAASGFDTGHPWLVSLAQIMADDAAATCPVGISSGDAVCKQADEIASRIGNIAILIEAIFDKLDVMSCDTPEHHKLHNAISCFSNSVMESAQAIRSANEQILSLARGGVQ